MRTRTYVKKGKWYLGRGQRRGGGLPIAGPLLASVAGSIAQPIFGKIVKKVLGGRKRRRRCKRKIA